MTEDPDNIVKSGNYVIVQKQGFRKLCKISENGSFTLGKQQVEMKNLIGKPYWTTFQMIQSKNNRKIFALEVAAKVETSVELYKDLSSGIDNRSITDDGTSQKLSTEDINGLRYSGKSSNEIVGLLIENSTSFAAKTEYSQEKYIKKKERKYFRYLTIRKTSIDHLQQIYFKQDYAKISCLRADTLAQLLSYCDIKANGTYMLYDSGSMGLPAAAMLNRIGPATDGVLIHLHPGNQAQSMLVQAMNYPDEQLQRLLAVNLYSFLRLHYQGETAVMDEIAWKNFNSTPRDQTNKNSRALPKAELVTNSKELHTVQTEQSNRDDEEKSDNSTNLLKRKSSDDQDTIVGAKRPKWLLETGIAVEHCKGNKVQGLVVIAKEHPLNIVEALLPFLGASRPFVIHHCYREPLQETYVALKQRRDIINLKLLMNLFRSYQVLQNRTHPDILTSDLGGYLLTGYLVG